jgi:hypothetical protein
MSLQMNINGRLICQVYYTHTHIIFWQFQCVNAGVTFLDTHTLNECLSINALDVLRVNAIQTTSVIDTDRVYALHFQLFVEHTLTHTHVYTNCRRNRAVALHFFTRDGDRLIQQVGGNMRN